MSTNQQLKIKGKNVLVVGLAKTGISAARFLHTIGAVVTATDASCAAPGISELENTGIKTETGRHSTEYFLNADLIVLSPGVPTDIEPVKAAKDKGIEIISEIELAYNFIDAPIIAATGTNGKTTATALLGRILSNAGKDVFVGGNIGTPLIDYAIEKKKADYVVAEVSSFQLEGIKSFKPYISILLNITEDHLDRYSSFRQYADAKFNIFKNQNGGDIAIVNIDDPTIKSQILNLQLKHSGTGPNPHIRIIPFSTNERLEAGVYFTGKEIACSINGTDALYSTEGIKLKGIHNIENIMAVIAAAKACDVRDDVIQETLKDFSGLPHRVEFVRELNGVSYYNDSKGTNIGALHRCLEGFNEPIILIAGGRDKGGDYSTLMDLIRKKVKLLLLMGEAKEKIKDSLGSCAETLFVSSMEDAVKKAHDTAVKGDIVLLSPACSSFDMFKDYKDRGEIFKRLVEAL